MNGWEEKGQEETGLKSLLFSPGLAVAMSNQTELSSEQNIGKWINISHGQPSQLTLDLGMLIIVVWGNGHQLTQMKELYKWHCHG